MATKVCLEPRCGKRFKPQDEEHKFCSRSCACSWQIQHGHRPQDSRVWRPVRAVDAKLDPTPEVVAWAAGIYEGEGSTYVRSKGGGILSISQKDPWILEKLKKYFGGTITRHSRKYQMFRWQVCGSRARWFAQSIQDYLSPWRFKKLHSVWLRGQKGKGLKKRRRVWRDTISSHSAPLEHR